MSDDTIRPHAPIEFRTAGQPLAVRFPERIIDVLAIPYDTEAVVEYRGRLVYETVVGGAFDGVQRRTDKVPVVRDHDMTRPVGRVLSLRSRDEGLVAEMKIGRGPLGDETLDFADDGILDSSVGFAPLPGHEHWSPDRSSRRITKAFLDHIALVPLPAYATAKVLAVRRAPQLAEPALVAVDTPNLDRIRIEHLRARYGALDQS